MQGETKSNNLEPAATDKRHKIMTRIFDYINIDIEEVQNFIEENGLSFVCNENMQIEASEEDFDKLTSQFPALDYAEA